MTTKQLAIVNKAIAIQGRILFAGLDIRQIRGEAKNGNVITGCVTPNLKGYMQIRKSAVGRLVAMAQDICDRESEITADQNANVRAALDL